MIAPMKKVHILFTDTAELSSVRSLGMLHVSEHQNEEVAQAGNEYERALMQFTRVVQAVGKYSSRTKKKQNFSVELANKYKDSIIEILKQQDTIKDRLSGIIDELKEWEPWGLVDPSDIEYLTQEGVRVQFYEIPTKQFDPEAFNHYIIVSKRSGIVRLLAVELLHHSFPAEHEALELPADASWVLEKEKAKLEQGYQNLEKELRSFSVHAPLLRAAVQYYEEQIAFFEAAKRINDDENFHWITGFVPQKNISELKKQASERSWGLLIQDPLEDEMPPTLIQVPKLVKLVRPIFNAFGTFPGYREFDISSLFLLFFTIFFTLIVADAGYATVLLVITVFLIIRSTILKYKVPPLLVLFVILSVAALIWGVLTANYFGFLPPFPIFQRFVIPMFSVWNTESNELIQFLSISIGAIHIGIAHLWRLIYILRSKHKLVALAELGHLSILAGFYFIILSIVVSPTTYPPPGYEWNLIFVGTGMVILFGQQSGKFFKGIIKGFSQSFFVLFDNIAIFSDIISYIRLYAVGLATFAVAKSFNQLAMGVITEGDILSFVIAGVILLCGHGLNMGMWALSVIVHGVRLNMLEFSSHLGVEWSGYKYSPLKESMKEGVQV